MYDKRIFTGGTAPDCTQPVASNDTASLILVQDLYTTGKINLQTLLYSFC